MTVSESSMTQNPVVVRIPPQQDASGGMLKAVGKLYCRLFHSSISQPVAGKYRCWKCLREFELEW